MSSRHRCKRCGASFSSNGALQQHVKTKHRSVYLAYRAIPIIIVALAVVGGVLALYITQPGGTTTQSGTSTHMPAPDFELRRITASGLTEDVFRLSSVRGSPVFMDFAFSWCPHCNNMAPIVKRLRESYAEKGVFFLTVAGDDARTDEKQTAEFLARHGVSWTVVFDEQLRVFDLYSVRGTPTYIVINRDGEIVGRLEGEQSYEDLSALIERAMTR